MRATRRTCCVLLAVLILVSCGGPRVAPTLREDAQQDQTVCEVLVHKVWDQVDDPILDVRDPRVSHFIEVDVLSGRYAGRKMTLPYDRWSVGLPPPREGTRLVITIAQWVTRDPNRLLTTP